MPPSVTESSLLLAQLWAEGDRNAGDKLVSQHLPSIKRYFAYRVRDTFIQDDLVQDTLLALIVAVPNFDGRSSFRTFLLGVARNHLHSWLRRNYRQPYFDEFESLEIEDDAESALARTLRREDVGILELAMGTLTPMAQQMLRLRYWHNHSSVELAREFNMTASAVRSHLARTRRDLLRKITEREDCDHSKRHISTLALHRTRLSMSTSITAEKANKHRTSVTTEKACMPTQKPFGWTGLKTRGAAHCKTVQQSPSPSTSLNHQELSRVDYVWFSVAAAFVFMSTTVGNQTFARFLRGATDTAELKNTTGSATPGDIRRYLEDKCALSSFHRMSMSTRIPRGDDSIVALLEPHIATQVSTSFIRVLLSLQPRLNSKSTERLSLASVTPTNSDSTCRLLLSNDPWRVESVDRSDARYPAFTLAHRVFNLLGHTATPPEPVKLRSHGNDKGAKDLRSG